MNSSEALIKSELSHDELRELLSGILNNLPETKDNHQSSQSSQPSHTYYTTIRLVGNDQIHDLIVGLTSPKFPYWDINNEKIINITRHHHHDGSINFTINCHINHIISTLKNLQISDIINLIDDNDTILKISVSLSSLKDFQPTLIYYDAHIGRKTKIERTNFPPSDNNTNTKNDNNLNSNICCEFIDEWLENILISRIPITRNLVKPLKDIVSEKLSGEFHQAFHHGIGYKYFILSSSKVDDENKNGNENENENSYISSLFVTTMMDDNQLSILNEFPSFNQPLIRVYYLFHQQVTFDEYSRYVSEKITQSTNLLPDLSRIISNLL